MRQSMEQAPTHPAGLTMLLTLLASAALVAALNVISYTVMRQVEYRDGKQITDNAL